MFEPMIAALKLQKRRIVFTEGTDPRILEAASRLQREEILTPILLGNRMRSTLLPKRVTGRLMILR